MRNEYVSDTFQDCIDSDFNPDIIGIAIDDCYKQGVKDGRLYGFAIGIVTELAITLALANLISYYQKKSKEKAKESE